MAINPSVPSSMPASIPLSAFQDAARQGQDVVVTLDGDAYRVLALGQLNTPEGQRAVEWVQPTAGTIDTASLFRQALEEAFDRVEAGGRKPDSRSRLVELIATEVNLGPSPGKPLPAHVIEQAISIASTATTAMDGVEAASFLRNRMLPPSVS